jgi:hypothetical protein
MRWLTAVLALAATFLGAMVPDTASAHGYYRGPRVSIGFGFGGYWPGYWPGYWAAPYPYYPAPYYYGPAVTTAPEPTSYIERGDDTQPSGSAASTPRRDWWYYCPETQIYYPYVKQCSGGWQRVEPRPQGEPGDEAR